MKKIEFLTWTLDQEINFFKNHLKNHIKTLFRGK